MWEQLRPHWRYLKYVMRHKYYVYVEGRKLGLGHWQLLVHDLSKFRPSEWFPYVDAFHGSRAAVRRDKTGYYKPDETGHRSFEVVWHLHWHRNPHHWEFWLRWTTDGRLSAFPMPDKYRREMLADWRGAGRAQGKPNTRAWYMTHRDRIFLHPDTRAWVDAQLQVPA